MNRRFLYISIVFSLACFIPFTALAAQNQAANPLLQAIANGDADQVQQAISSGAVNINARINELGWTPLHAAAKFGKGDIVSMLIQNQADMNVQDNSGQTPLCMAVESGQADVVNLLISNGANVNITNNSGDSALSLAQKIGLTAIGNTLIQAGASPQPGAENTGMQNTRRGNRRGGNNFQGNTMTGRRGMPETVEAPDVATDITYPDQSVSIDNPAGGNIPGEADTSLDPNEVKARLQQYEGLEKEVADVADNSRIGMRQWQRTDQDNRTLLLSAIRRQYQAELEFIKKTADGENAKKTSEAADNLLTTRRERLAKITRELRDQAALLERQNRGTTTTSRRGARTTTTRGARRGTMVAPEIQPNSDMPYTNVQPEESKYDPETQSEVDTWLNASVENISGRIDFMNTMNDMVTAEISSLKPIANEENAEKTIAVIDGLLIARQQRFSEMQTELEDLQQQQQNTQPAYDPATGMPYTDPTGQNMTMPTRGATRRGR